MNEKPLSPPPPANLAIKQLEKADMQAVSWFLNSLDIWLKRLRDLLPKIATYSVTLDPTTVSANTTSEQTFAVPGITMQDILYLNKPSHQAGIGIVNVRASAADQIAITFMNTTGSGVDPAAETYLLVAVRL